MPSEMEFGYIQTLLRERAAIMIEPGKEYLVESRLAPLARREGFSSLTALVARLQKDKYNGLHRKVVEAMTTNETSFFRDVHPFEALKQKLIPELMENRANDRTLNIWCGASSSGQEPYTIALVLREHFPALQGWTVRFIASDISQEMLSQARSGTYSQLEVNRGLPVSYLVKYFQRVGTEWQIREELRNMIDFREVNLSQAWPVMPAMDIIFLRNVMIYFDLETKKTILDKLHLLLKPGGYLFLGTAETTLNIVDTFERTQFDKAMCYRPRK